MDVAVASFIPKEMRKKTLTACVQKASGIELNTDLFSEIINVACVICFTQYFWVINLKYIIYLDDYKSQF